MDTSVIAYIAYVAVLVALAIVGFREIDAMEKLLEHPERKRPACTVTLVSGGVVVKTWEADSYTTDAHRLYIYLPGAEYVIVVGGPCVVEPIR